MQIKTFECPACGGMIKIDVDSGKKSGFCGSCGHQLFYDDQISKTEHKEVIIDEARIHEANIQERIRLKELELQIEEKKTRRIKNIVIASFIAFMIVVMSIGFLIDVPGIAWTGFGVSLASLIAIGIKWIVDTYERQQAKEYEFLLDSSRTSNGK